MSWDFILSKNLIHLKIVDSSDCMPTVGLTSETQNLSGDL